MGGSLAKGAKREGWTGWSRGYRFVSETPVKNGCLALHAVRSRVRSLEGSCRGGAVGETMFGRGFPLLPKGVEGYQWGQSIAKDQRMDSFSGTETSEGDGAMVDWLQYGLRYAHPGLQLLLTGLAPLPKELVGVPRLWT